MKKLQLRTRIIFIIASLFIMFFGVNKLYEKPTRRPPLVYLVPADYFGPVFVFFGQKDGVDLLPDPLGLAVLIPENGVVKIKNEIGLILDKKRPDYQNMYWISLSENGTRKKMIINENTMQDSDGSTYEVYYDEDGKPHKHPSGSGKFEYFSEKQKSETMIFGNGGCGRDNFIPENDSTSKSPVCGRFLVISPNAYLGLPKWMWEDAHHSYASIQQLVEEFNDRLKEKKSFYKLP